MLAPVAPRLAAADRGYAADELARAGTELVRHLVGAGLGVIVFEDLHWADAESLALFHRLALTAGLPVLLVGSYRPEDLDRRHVTDLVSAVERNRQVNHVALDRLTTDEVAGLVGPSGGTGELRRPPPCNVGRAATPSSWKSSSSLPATLPLTRWPIFRCRSP